MARKSFEKKLYEWLCLSVEQVSEEAFSEYRRLFEKEFGPMDYFLDIDAREKGRPCVIRERFRDYIKIPEEKNGQTEKFDLSKISIAEFAICMDKLDYWENEISTSDKYDFLTKKLTLYKNPITKRQFYNLYNKLLLNKPSKKGIEPYPKEKIQLDKINVKEFLKSKGEEMKNADFEYDFLGVELD